MPFALYRAALVLTFCVSCAGGDEPARDADGAGPGEMTLAGSGGSGGAEGGASASGAAGAGFAASAGSGSVGSSAGGVGAGGVAASGGAPAAASAGDAPDAGIGTAGAAAGVGGAGGAPSGGSAGGTGGMSGAGGAPEPSARCAAIEAEYTSSFTPQLTCQPGAANQCEDRIEAAPGCDCRVFIEPKDPFAIEHLTNVFIEWLDADCENPTCPSTCPNGTRGTCGANGVCTEAP
ncbi:MAG TPA: hypothetical protein VMG12_21810 [Polyangiaceae bacterium]|nr:hypothetical protein [Polyangiaceae bacterium]